MATRLPIHSQLSTIMENMAKTVLSQVCKLVDEDTAELRLECSRLLFANSALSEKVNNLQCELTVVKTNASKSRKSHRTVGVQTVSSQGGDHHDTSQPTIEKIFGKDWCKDLWKDRDPSALDKVADSLNDACDKTNAVMNQGADEKKDCTVASSSLQPNTHGAKGDEGKDTATEITRKSKRQGTHPCTVHQNEKSSNSLEDNPMQLEDSNDTDGISTYTIPIEDDEEDDDVQFVHESQQGPSQSIPTNSDDVDNLDDLDTFDNFDFVDTVMDSNQSSFTCRICNRSFFHKGTLTHHMKSHKSNFCHICKQEFPLGQLDTHVCVPPVASHKVSKSCELCGKVFANPSALRIHYVVHTGEKPYRCSICGKGFTQKGNLKCHLRIHSGERPFQCMWCGKTFTQKVNLNHHLMSHRNQNSAEESSNE
ncbi:zinc finger protein 473 homolog [Boleophthalmus pectinirostris]|uniref:zinc finger protein 473 homolog n=1 Tax=Boleophthalmus pectinirostris TaxID=150288 RepID=UPI000A1C4CD6|nr:zinc finger protein 473 homolog [Boleophthalmus pectinirostris]